MSREPYGYIYKTIFPDGKYYIGQSKGTTIRKYYYGSGIYINKYLSTHGSELLQREVLRWVSGSQKELNDAEAFFVGDKYKTDVSCVNFQPGGNQSGASDEFREKMRIINTGKKLSADTRAKLSAKLSIIQTGSGNSFYGKKHSEETKAKMRKQHKTYIRKLVTV